MGCGRLGAQLAILLSQSEHDVVVLDTDARSLRRLLPDFKGVALLGSGLDEKILKKANIEKAQAFVAVTQGDNRNIMAAQIAKAIFHVPKVICRIYDPLRSELYSRLGLETISSTTIVAQILMQQLEG